MIIYNHVCDMIKVVVLWLLELLELITSKFYTITLYDVNPIDSNKNIITFQDKKSDYAIVMQGPLIKKANYTILTLNLYRKLYPEIRIILSTWRGLDQRTFEYLKNINVEVIESDQPKLKGWANINLQIYSTNAALNRLLIADTVVTYVLKTRTDQRVNCNSDFLGFMGRMVDNSSSITKACAGKLVVCNLNMFKERLYIVSDMFMFGHISQMSKFWNLPMQTDLGRPEEISFLQQNRAEAYLINHFMDINKFIPEYTNLDSKKFIAAHFEVIDKNALGLHWYKYNHFINSKYLFAPDGKLTVSSVFDYF